METLFKALEETVNKHAIDDFKKFVAAYHDVTKWFICSDYCLDDETKPNDVITFVFYPYIFDLQTWKVFVAYLQKTDLKNCRTVSDEFCKFSHMGAIFSFSFIIDKKSIVNKWKDPATLQNSVDILITLIEEKWKVNTPHMAVHYDALLARLKQLKEEMKKKTFNYKLLSRIFLVVFLISYLKYLLYREVDNVEIFTWLSDRDKITTFCDEIYKTLYEIQTYCLCANYLPESKFKHVKECLPEGEDMFYDEVNRVADFICGGVASFDLVAKSVKKQKHCILVEDVLADNPNIQIFRLGEQDVARIVHRKV